MHLNWKLYHRSWPNTNSCYLFQCFRVQYLYYLYSVTWTISGSILQSLREINQTLGDNLLTVHFDKESEEGKENSTTVVSQFYDSHLQFKLLAWLCYGHSVDLTLTLLRLLIRIEWSVTRSQLCKGTSKGEAKLVLLM